MIRQYTAIICQTRLAAMTKPIHFEKTMIELEEIVMQLEKGELSLEDSLKQFEKESHLHADARTF
ncbi:exodeoxyribonuclease VII small subunit [Legionella feeleii]